MKSKLIKSAFLIFLSLLIVSVWNPSSALMSTSIDQEIDALNLKIQNQKKQIESLQARQKEYQVQIVAKQNDQASLSNQLSVIENRIAKTGLDIEETGLEIDKTGLEIKKVEIDSANLTEKIEEQKMHISNLLRLVYKQEQTTALEALLLNDSLSDFLNQVKYLEDANIQIGASVKDLKQQKDQLEKNKEVLNGKSEDMLALKAKLEEKKSGLEWDQESKNSILEETKSSEKAFQSLLTKARAEQQQAQIDITNAENSIRQKMSQKDKNKLEDGDSVIAWPVAKNYITTGFHDPDYPFRKIIGEHSAIDIRAPQGSTLRTAADGYVAKVKFNGSKNYAYIMIIHGNNLSTVYGHVSAVNVSVDQYVVKGQVIGRTGATPGTAGAGPFTTGPHLHFEVRKDGIPVNPLNYMQ
ncbi:MAG TPA: peptidoglycan DD-metalloendopeptidase family protein [Candidatus Saccharimonadales bacterium]|nr:peptidoglycan DD-metalloendopeptidase family protein [Candidatus Saccharimonadales bacterium]